MTESAAEDEREPPPPGSLPEGSPGSNPEGSPGSKPEGSVGPKPDGPPGPKPALNARNSRELLHAWLRGVRIAERAHLRSATHYQRNHLLLGVPVTVLSIVVGTSVFATLESSAARPILITAGVISVLAAVLSGLQTFLNYAERGIRHAEAAREFGKLRKRIEVSLVRCSDQELDALLDKVRSEWDALQEQVPTPTQGHHDAAVRLVGKG